MYGAVRLNNVYPGVTAAFTTSTLEVSSPLSIGQGKVIFSVAPGADPGLIRLRVLNTGTVPFEGPGGIWFAGGSIPGVFTVSASAAQSGVAIASQLKIESLDTLSVQLPSRDASLPATVVMAFPNYDLIRPSLTPGPFFTARIEYPSNFGEDGGSNDCGNRNCSDALVARLDDEGKPLWVTTFGGGGDDEANVGASVKDGVVVAGNTASSDFPVVASAPHPAPGSANADGFLAFFDAASGALRSATYLGLKGSAWVQQLVPEAGGDVAVSGGYVATSTESRGYVQRWRPAENRFIYSLLFDSPVASLAFDASSNLYYGAAMSASILAPGTGVRPQTIGVGVAKSVKALFPSVGGVVFIR